MRRERLRPSPNTAVVAGKSSIPNFQQGACLAEEVGGVGGETSGTARVRAGFAPNKYIRARAAVLILRAGVRGQPAPESASSLPEAELVYESASLFLSTGILEVNIQLRLCRAKKSAQSAVQCLCISSCPWCLRGSMNYPRPTQRVFEACFPSFNSE